MDPKRTGDAQTLTETGPGESDTETQTRSSVSLEDVAVGTPTATGPAAQAISSLSHSLRGAPALAAGLRSGRITRIDKGHVFASFRGTTDEVECDVDDAVDLELLVRSHESGDRVLIEVDADGEPVVVGVIQTRIPDKLEIRARQIVIDADEELVLRSGKAAMRLREDGDVELVGSRISTTSRGLFRLVGRMLRLN